MPAKDKPGHITIAGNTFTPEDINHLVTSAQSPPSEFEKEVDDGLDELIEKFRKEKTTS